MGYTDQELQEKSKSLLKQSAKLKQASKKAHEQTDRKQAEFIASLANVKLAAERLAKLSKY